MTHDGKTVVMLGNSPVGVLTEFRLSELREPVQVYEMGSITPKDALPGRAELGRVILNEKAMVEAGLIEAVPRPPNRAQRRVRRRKGGA